MSNFVEEIGIVVRADGTVELANGMKVTGEQIGAVGRKLDELAAATEKADQEMQGATKQTGALGAAMRKTRQDTDDAAKAAERLIGQQRRAVETFGMSRAEVVAYDAAAAGLTGRNLALARTYADQLQHLERAAAAKRELAALTTRLGLAAGVAMTAAGAYTVSLIKEADQLQALSERTRMTTAELAAMKYAADQADVSFESLIGVVTNMPRVLASAREEGSNTARALRALGLKPGELQNTTEGLMLLADRVREIHDPMTRAATLTLLFRRNGEELLPFFSQGAEGIRKLLAEGTEYNRLTPQMADGSAKFSDELGKLKTAVASLGRDMVSELLPGMTRLITEAQTGIRVFGGFRAAIWELGFKTPLGTTNKENADEAQREITRLEGVLANIDAGRGWKGRRDAIVDELETQRKRERYFSTLMRRQIEDGARESENAYWGGPPITATDRSRAARDALNGKVGGAGANVAAGYLEQLQRQLRGVTGETSAYADALAYTKTHAKAFNDETKKSALETAKLIDQRREEVDLQRAKEKANAIELRGWEDIARARERSMDDWLDWAAQQRQEIRDREFEISLIGKTAEQVGKLTIAYNAEREAKGRRAQVFDDVEAGRIGPERARQLLDEIERIRNRKVELGNEELADKMKPGWQRMLDGWRDTNQLMVDFHNSAMDQVLRNGEDVWVEWATTGKLNAKRLIDGILAEFARLQYRKFMGGAMGAGGGFDFMGGLSRVFGFPTDWTLALGSARQYLPMSMQVSAMGGGNVGFAPGAGAMHAGGIVGGRPTFTRAVDPGVFANAPRFHGGGMIGRDEVPIIAKRGEGVFTREQMAALQPAGSSTVVQFAPVINIDARTDRAEVEKMVTRAMQASQADLMEKLDRRMA